MPYLLSAGIFLVQTIFGFFIVLFLVRVMLIAVGAPFNEPVCRFVYSLTNRVVTPLRSVIPRFRRIELSSLLIAWVLATLELLLLLSMVGWRRGVASVLCHGLIDTLDWIVLIELGAIIIYCILSYIPSARYDSNFRLLAQFVEPVVRPFRRLVPPIAGLDFSCWFASIALILVRMLVISPLSDLSQRL
jgi:YggT family protein